MLYIKRTDLVKRMSQVRTSVLLKRSRPSAAARNRAFYQLFSLKTTL